MENGIEYKSSGNATLSLLPASVNHTGIYTCIATNMEGSTESNTLPIHVKCKFPSLNSLDLSIPLMIKFIIISSFLLEK